MTLSVGLGRIINDPNASVLIRKALGALSTPALIVTDQGVTIDDNGRIAIRLNPSGGLTQDENGLATVPGEVVFTGRATGDPETNFIGVEVGLEIPTQAVIDTAWSFWCGDATLGGSASVENQYGYCCGPMTKGDTRIAAFLGEVASGSGRWNVLMTGTAPNHFAGSVAIGTEDVTAKLSVLSITEQLRLLYNSTNYLSFTVSSAGALSITANGTAADINLTTGSGRGITLNGGSAIKRVITAVVTVTLTKLEGSYDLTGAVSGAIAGDSVIVSPVNGTPDVLFVRAWSGAVYADGVVTIRVRCGNLGGGTVSQDFRVTVIGF